MALTAGQALGQLKDCKTIAEVTELVNKVSAEAVNAKPESTYLLFNGFDKSCPN